MAEDEIQELKESRDETFTRLLGEASPDIKEEILKDEVELRKAAIADERTYFEKKIDILINWLIVAGILYVLKQLLWSKLVGRKIKNLIK